MKDEAYKIELLGSTQHYEEIIEDEEVIYTTLYVKINDIQNKFTFNVEVCDGEYTPHKGCAVYADDKDTEFTEIEEIIYEKYKNIILDTKSTYDKYM